MSMSIRYLLASMLLAAVELAHAQSFPEGSTKLTDSEIRKRLNDTVFSVKLADGTTWRLDFKARGHFFVDTSTGFRSSGDWTVEDGRLCGQLRGRDKSCNDVRLYQDILYLKRDSGEVIQYIPK